MSSRRTKLRALMLNNLNEVKVVKSIVNEFGASHNVVGYMLYHYLSKKGSKRLKKSEVVVTIREIAVLISITDHSALLKIIKSIDLRIERDRVYKDTIQKYHNFLDKKFKNIKNYGGKFKSQYAIAIIEHDILNSNKEIISFWELQNQIQVFPNRSALKKEWNNYKHDYKKAVAIIVDLTINEINVL